jgi:hypothetical protein
VYAAVSHITIGDNFDDFVRHPIRTKPAAPVGEANMRMDSAIVYLDRSLVIAKALSNTDQSQTRLTRAGEVLDGRLAHAQPARTTPANPLVNDAGANADATAASGS